MTYEDKAALVSRELAAGATLSDALRMADLRSEPRRRPRWMSPVLRGEIRRRRKAGEKASAIAADLNVSMGTVSQHCRDIAVPKPGRLPITDAVLARATAACGTTVDAFYPDRRGKPHPAVSSARRVAMIALRALGATVDDLAVIFRRRPSEISSLLNELRARSDLQALAQAIADELRSPAASDVEHAA